ncbi:MAG TPA: hypothetical protein VGO47_00235, partial [Chlamydiales bacterium]|nr:hypothetical protein [Chlamydiales bacterium]
DIFSFFQTCFPNNLPPRYYITLPLLCKFWGFSQTDDLAPDKVMLSISSIVRKKKKKGFWGF